MYVYLYIPQKSYTHSLQNGADSSMVLPIYSSPITSRSNSLSSITEETVHSRREEEELAIRIINEYLEGEPSLLFLGSALTFDAQRPIFLAPALLPPLPLPRHYHRNLRTKK